MGVITAIHPIDDNKVRRVSYKNQRKDEPLGHYSGAKFTSIERAVHTRLIFLVAADE